MSAWDTQRVEGQPGLPSGTMPEKHRGRETREKGEAGGKREKSRYFV
jgi:hypothetical protein